MWFRYIGVPSFLYLIRPNISMKMSTQRDFFRYRSVYRKNFKRNKEYTGYVEDHHIIPKQWKHHELMEILNFDVHCSKNLYIMPNTRAKYRFYLHPSTMIHTGGHRKYNDYVKEQLDYILELDKESQKYNFWLLLHHLKSNMKFNKDNVPWK